MIHYKNFMKIISVLIIITFIFQGDLFLYPKGEDGLDDLFNKARNEYNNGQYVTSKKRLEGIVGEIKENVLDEKEILGKSYLLLGAIYEKEEKTNLARENYRKAIKDYKVQSIDGVDFIGLIILEKVIKEITQGPIKEEGEIDNKFNKARDEYVDGKYDNLKERLEIIIGFIKETGSDRVDILGMCYLLLGAVYEKEKLELLAEENYRKAKEDYDIQSIAGVNLEKLAIYKKIITGLKGTIEKEGKKIKKKFPWLLVIGGVIVVTVAAILLLKKKKKKECTLTVNLGKGVDGTPESTTTYPRGSRVNYSYSLKPGYTNLVVTLDGNVVPFSDKITMNIDRTLTASATPNVVDFVTDKDEVSIDEGNTSTFGVRLSAPPPDDFEATVSWASGDESIRVKSGGNLIFTSSNWNEYKTVTLEALEDDADASNGQATIRISAPGIQDKDITVTEIDNDSLNFVTNTDKISVPEGGTAIFRVRLSSRPSSDVAASISRLSGDSDISISSGFSLTFNSTNWDKYQDVTLEAAEDADVDNDVATIGISAPGIDPKNIIATEVDNDTINFVTDKDEVSIEEGKANTFQVTLSSQPSSIVTASISRISGDSDIRVTAGSSLTFTPSNWNTYQTVTLEAAEDADTGNGVATIRISATGIPDKEITATEVDNDSGSLYFVTDKEELSVPENGANTFKVKLSVKPASMVVTSVSFMKQERADNFRAGISPNSSSEIVAKVEKVSGDKDIRVASGENLTFTSSNWDKYQEVKLEAAEDTDITNGQAIIRISANGIPDKTITATEEDNDKLDFRTDKKNVSIEEGKTGTFQVKLSSQPPSNVTASISRVSGDSDISVSAGSKSLTFTPSNWNKYKTVTLEASEDDDEENGKATIRISAPGIPREDITATEDDNDILKFVTDQNEVSIPEGGKADFQVKLSRQPSDNVEASISTVIGGDSDISVVSGANLNFDSTNWDDYQTVTLEAAEDDDAENGESTIQISATGIPDKEITATEQDNDIQYTLIVTKDAGVDGTPDSGTYIYNSGTSVGYDYILLNGYSNLVVKLDGIEVSASDTIIMDKDHTLEAAATANVVEFVTDKENVTIREGETGAFNVSLSVQPQSSVYVTVSWVPGGDPDITVFSGKNLTFTPSDWEAPQKVTLKAAEDEDAGNGVATIGISAFGIPDKSITVTEQDNDIQYTLEVSKSAGVGGTPESGTTIHAAGEIVSYSYSLQSGYANLVVKLDDIEVSPSGTITMNENHTLTATASAVVNFETDTDEI